jgi:uncharacterized protein YndB with AHSA1/START domain
MTVISVEKDLDSLTLTLIAEFDAPIERVWQLLSDPRQLEAWWGPPGAPATVQDHELTPGGRVTYFMTLPEGRTSRGWWRITSVSPPESLEFVDGFADQDGSPIVDGPTTTIRVRLSELGGSTRMEVRSTFESREHMQRVVKLGAPEAFAAAVGQMDALLAD